MTAAHGLYSDAEGSTLRLQWRPMAPLAQPRQGQVLVEVHASAVNPIDVKRAMGYGRRLLRLKGAAGLPRILGNDLVGRVRAVGPGVDHLRSGQRVWGVLGTGPVGAHASQALVRAEHLLAAPEAQDDAALAVLPYTFCTLWLCLRQAGLHSDNARARRVLVHGASGGLGLLALQLLQHWGAYSTAVCSTANAAACRQAGAHEVLDRLQHSLQELPSNYDAVLNFANWDDEATLAERLAPQALGLASTTHPLLGTLDRDGWLRGAVRLVQERQRVLKTVRRRSAQARYGWTVFRPDGEALAQLQLGVARGVLHLPVALQAPADDALPAFAHVQAGRSGRAALTLAY